LSIVSRFLRFSFKQNDNNWSVWLQQRHPVELEIPLVLTMPFSDTEALAAAEAAAAVPGASPAKSAKAPERGSPGKMPVKKPASKVPKAKATTKAQPKPKPQPKKSLKRPAARADVPDQTEETDQAAEADAKKKKGNKGVSRSKDEERAQKLQELEDEQKDTTAANGGPPQSVVRDKQKSQWFHRHLKSLPEEVPKGCTCSLFLHLLYVFHPFWPARSARLSSLRM